MVFYELEEAILYLKASLKKGPVVIKSAAKKRTLSQNSYFHGFVCAVFGAEFGLTKDEAKQIFKQEFLKYEKKNKTFVKDTSSLKKDEMSEFIDKCRMFAANHGCYIPSPEDVNEGMIDALEKIPYL